MFFNSIQFCVFLPIVFVLYWFVLSKSKSTQNAVLIVASYYFYACWDWRFLFLLIFSTVLDYFMAIQIQDINKKRYRKFWFWLSISLNLGFLGIFKYYDFFAVSFAELLNNMGLNISPKLLQLILPIGISFYTFHGLSYIIDIYFNRIKAEKNYIDYSLFVCYFPLLVAGPIERATHLLPQIKVKRVFNHNQAVLGIKLIIFGLFKKIVIADNCAFFVNQIFENYGQFSAAELWIGAILFSFQIYGDFSGYSDIARGVSKLFGIELLINFNFPYFAVDIADFWRRWHISLSSWFRDYIYIPLGGSRGTKSKQIKNIFLIFLVSGFWHGANWTFIVWGLLHALYFLPLFLLKKNRDSLAFIKYKSIDFFKMMVTFILVCVAWIIFRSDTLSGAFGYLYRMFIINDVNVDFFFKNSKYILLTFISFFSIFVFILIEFRLLKKNEINANLPKSIFYLLILMIFFMGTFKNQLSFIYFQF